jgi:hypothetical protein
MNMSMYRVMCEYENVIDAQSELIRLLSKELAMHEDLKRVEGLSEKIRDTEHMRQKLLNQ